MNAQAKNIVEYDEFRGKLNEVKEACNFVPDVSTDDGYKASKRLSLDVGKVLTSLESKRKELKSESLEFGRKVDADAKSIAAELEAFQLPHKDAYKELDKLKKERELRRKEGLEARVNEIRELPEAMADSDSEGVKMALESLNSEECLDFYEFTEQALKARNASKESLSKMFGEKLKHESEQAELAKLRKEAEEARIVAETKARKEREEKIARDAAEQAESVAAAAVERERLAIEKAEADKIAAASEAKTAVAKAAKEAKAKAEAAAKAETERVERERQDDIKAEEDARAKRAANTRHKSTINLAAVAALIEHSGLDEDQAKAVVVAIAERKVPAVSIEY